MRFFTLTCLLLLVWSTNFATPLTNSPSVFDIKKANQQYDRINLQLSVQNLNLNNLNSAVKTLTRLSAKAEQCVEDVQKKINNTEMLIKEANTVVDNKSEGADLVYLNNQQKILADEQAQCRLFSIRAKEAIEAYKTAIAQLKQAETLTRGLPLWRIIDQTIHSPIDAKFIQVVTSQIPAVLPSSLTWAAIILVAAICSIFLLLKVHKNRVVRHYLRFRKLHTHYFILLTAFFTSAALFFYLLIAQDLTTSDLPLILAGVILFYLSSLVVILFAFKLKKIKALFYWYSLNDDFFQSFFITVLSFYTAVMIGQLFSSYFDTNNSYLQLCQSLFIIIALAASAYFIYYFCKTHRHFSFIKHHYHFIQRFSILLLIACALIDSIGYYSLAQHLTYSGFSTFAIIFITVLIVQGINKLYLMLHQQPSTKAKIIKYFGYKADQNFTEFLILKTLAQLIVIIISIYFIGQSWGFATDLITSIYDQIIHGVHIVNFTFYPTRIISGIVIFCLLYLLFRALSTSVSNHQQFEDEEETQVAVASILTYIGFALALISGLLVAGFDFTGLAIIAGALSVGIGLGLQSIVNNFVSGIILLIEKPIKPGDRINVDGVEGFVKKIRVRSTQILTPGREDIIVPNSDLITRRVTNYMYSDKFCQIKCEVGVAYGTDTKQVQNVLLEIANQHDEVVKSGRNKPVVLFRSFADNTMVFQLGCLIKDVNKRSQVNSDLNFAIEEAFRKHNIEMPFPQREIHLKLSELSSLAKQLQSK